MLEGLDDDDAPQAGGRGGRSMRKNMIYSLMLGLGLGRCVVRLMYYV